MKGFTLVELLVVIAIIAILASVVILIINPLELMRRSRDSIRLKDLDNLQQAINVTLQEGSMSLSPVSILCKSSGSYPCTGSSNSGTRATNGSGWIKADLASQNSVTVPTLPIDPVNNSEFHYTYCADNDLYELNAVMESDQLRAKMFMDGGNAADLYEVGSSYTLIAASGGGCEY